MGNEKINPEQIHKIKKIFADFDPKLVTFLKENNLKFKILEISYLDEDFYGDEI